MPITAVQKTAAENAQRNAAIDPAHQIRLVAGPGTGKSRTIIKRIIELLNNGAIPSDIYVISFTRATCMEIKHRIQSDCASLPCAGAAAHVNVSTMHSLALRILRRANLLNNYPTTPIMLDKWEQEVVYDIELASSIGCTPSRAEAIRLAHDASWQTLNTQLIAQPPITPDEIVGFNSFHSAKTNLYCCVLPGEVIFRCVDAMRQGVLNASQLPRISHLIVDEYQDLNACDQEFVHQLSLGNATLFIAGDDDQSIYSFRHANPNGIIQFNTIYPGSSTHVLQDCFRCTPGILNPASQLITYNLNRVVKNIVSLYSASNPPVLGRTLVWSFQTAQQEAAAIAQSCQALINGGMAGSEDQIMILISNRKVQLPIIAQELGNLGILYDTPPNKALAGEHDVIRAVYCIMRLIRENISLEEDYIAYRDLLEVLSGVGPATANAIGNGCISNNQNFRQLFYQPSNPAWLNGRCASAVHRIKTIIQLIHPWSLNDTLNARANDIATVLSANIFNGLPTLASYLSIWNSLQSALPQQITLEELSSFVSADNPAAREIIINAVNLREGVQSAIPSTKKVKILTMHGAKGLGSKVVFIPSVEQGILPSNLALQVAGLVIEQRRLFYVSLTRAMACCIISHAASHTGASAMALGQSYVVRFSRSQFLNEMNCTSVTRTGGLSTSEATTIVTDINNL